MIPEERQCDQTCPEEGEPVVQLSPAQYWVPSNTRRVPQVYWGEEECPRDSRQGGAHPQSCCSSGTDQRANGRRHRSRTDKHQKSWPTSVRTRMGHYRTNLPVAMLREYGNCTSQDPHGTSLANRTKPHPHGRRCHNAAKCSQGTGGKSSGWGVYTVSYPATWKDEHCRESTSRPWKLQPTLLCWWSLGFVFWRK